MIRPAGDIPLLEHNDEANMRASIISDNDELASRVMTLLAHNDIHCGSEDIVDLEAAAEHCSRRAAELLVLVLPDDPALGLRVLRETRGTASVVHCLMVGPVDDARLILGALREGADEYIDESLIDSQLPAALVRMKEKNRATVEPKKTGRVISVMAPSGGSGASTLASNIAAVFAQLHGECGLIDLRLAAGDLAPMLDLRPMHTIADLCERLSRVDSSMFEQFFARHSSGVRLLAAPLKASGVKWVTNKGVRTTMAMARARFQYVVADLDNTFGNEQVEALWQSDVILLVLRLDYISLRNTLRTMDDLAELGIGLQRIRLVANGTGQSGQLGIAEAEQALGVKLTHSVPSDPYRVNRAVNKGVPMVLQNHRSKLCRSIRHLAESLNGCGSS